MDPGDHSAHRSGGKIIERVSPPTVLLCGVPPLLAGILERLLAETSRVTRIEARPEPHELARALNEMAPALVIIHSDGSLLDPTARLVLEERAGVRILALSARGRRAYLYELNPRQTPLGEVSASMLRRLLAEPHRVEIPASVPD
jgi:hypothetical protein